MNLINSSKFSDFNKLINNKKFKKIFIITGENSFYKSKANLLIKFSKNKTLKFFFKKSKFPELPELYLILKEVNSFKPDIILSIGGGAVIDYSKIVSIFDYRFLKDLHKNLLKYENISKKKIYPLIALPTTAGAGAEVTSNAVIYIKGIKYSVENPLLIPNYYFLFPSLIIKNPKSLKSSAGFDAIAQSVESLISIKSNKTSLYYAKKSLELSLTNYLPFIKKPNIENSNKMLISSNLAGKAINISKTTAPHAVSYPFSSMFGVSHGHAVSLTFEKFLLFNYLNLNRSLSSFNLNDRYKKIFELFKVKNINELCQKIKYIKYQANLSDSFTKLGINISESSDKILNQINTLRLKNNPVMLTKNDIRKILND